jgi:Acyl-CoA dehydrogenase, C-terminal domain
MTMPTQTQGGDVQPEEFAAAAEAAVQDAKGRAPREAAVVLARAGLTGVLSTDTDGGLGLTLSFARPIAEVAGRLQLRFPLIEQMLLARAFAGTPMARAITTGERLGAIAWQGGVGEDLAGHARHVAECDWVLVAAEAQGALLVEVAGLKIENDGALDPDVPQSWLRVAHASVVARLDPDTYAQLRSDALILFAAFVTGAAQGAIERTATHVATRTQFGRKLSANQAVRHWMARMQLVSEVSAAATRRVLVTDEYDEPRDPRPTFVGAIANAAFVVEKAIQLHGGMGFTWEIPLHYSLRDIRAIEAALDAGAMAHDIGRRLIETNHG